MIDLLGFCVFSAISAFVYWRLISTRWRSLFLFICSLFFIALFSIPYAFYFLFNIVVVYVVAFFISREHKRKELFFKCIFIWLIVNLCFFKYANLVIDAIFKTSFRLTSFPQIKLAKVLLPLGLSYIIFRLIHYIVEVYRDNTPRGSFVDFALYVLFFPTFLAGPVERFPAFQFQTIGKNDFDISDTNYGLYRIIRGIIK